MAIYFVRHGQSETNVLNILYNKGSKYGLTEQGRGQVKELADTLKGLNVEFAKIISSPLLRAIETTHILANELNIEYKIIEYLREIDVGALDGTGKEETFKRENEITEEWLLKKNWEVKFEEGESFQDVIERFSTLIENEYGNLKSNENIIFVSHGGLIMCMMPYLCKNLDYEFCYKTLLKNAEYAVLEYREDNFYCLKY
jgi:2,3-bisphosphoglycerate-dependent phosphoglycerate mutase